MWNANDAELLREITALNKSVTANAARAAKALNAYIRGRAAVPRCAVPLGGTGRLWATLDKGWFLILMRNDDQEQGWRPKVAFASWVDDRWHAR